jgi:type II secretory pathway pseudopilin PulG
MENKDIVIICLIALIVYLYYQQSKQPNISDNSQVIQDLKQQINHYQTLYQKRVAKDLEVDQSAQIQQLSEEFQSYKTTAENEKNEIVTEKEIQIQLFQQKITDLETALLNLAKQKLKGKKQAEQLLKDLEKN